LGLIQTSDLFLKPPVAWQVDRMPYTAPSPLISAPRAESIISRPSSHGRHNSEPSLTSLGRGHNFLPSPSSSYIHRHRRSPSLHTLIPSHGRLGSQTQRTGSKRSGSDDTTSSQTPLYHSSLAIGERAAIRNASPIVVRLVAFAWRISRR
jgi:hypothetical protein